MSGLRHERARKRKHHYRYLRKFRGHRRERNEASQVLNRATLSQGDLYMRSKLALAALVAASFVGVTTMASAQTQTPAPGASSEGNVGTGATDTKMKSKKVSSNKKSGATTGMSKSKSSGQAGTDSGADSGGGMSK
jgi:hypothetical protein